MKNWKTLIALLAATLMVGCVAPEPKDEDTQPWCDSGECEPDPDPANAVMKGLFISGHLGNYDSCPGDGYSPNDDDAVRSEPAGDIAAVACAEGSDCGGAPLNCEDAQLTIRLANPGDVAISGIQVDELTLRDRDDAVLATLPLISTIDSATGAAFDGTLEPGEEVDLRILLLGPENLDDFTGSADQAIGSSGDGAFIDTTVSAEEHPSVTIGSDELYMLPSVAT